MKELYRNSDTETVINGNLLFSTMRIRGFAEEGIYLLVLEEHGNRAWHISAYPFGQDELERHIDVSPFEGLQIPVWENGLNCPLFRTAQEFGAEVDYKDPAETIAFAQGFLHDHYLKAYPDVPLETYLLRMQGGPRQETGEILELTDRMLEAIETHPQQFGIREDARFFREVHWRGRYRPLSPEAFESYTNGGEDPTENASSNSVGQSDGVAIAENHLVLFEIKAGKSQARKRDGRRQLKLQSYFVNHNFRIHPLSIRVGGDPTQLVVQSYVYSPQEENLVNDWHRIVTT